MIIVVSPTLYFRSGLVILILASACKDHVSTFRGNDPEQGLLGQEHNDSLRPYVVPGGSKRTIQRQLSLMGIDEFTIFGGLNSLSKSIKLEYRHAFRHK
jgi:hypothetical protein